MSKAGLDQWIKTNAWAIIAAAFALYGGYVTGQTTSEIRLDNADRERARFEREIERLESRLDGVRADPFTGTEGRELEQRLRDEINRRHP